MFLLLVGSGHIRSLGVGGAYTVRNEEEVGNCYAIQGLRFRSGLVGTKGPCTYFGVFGAETGSCVSTLGFKYTVCRYIIRVHHKSIFG